jgi:SRSO17 transposase
MERMVEQVPEQAYHQYHNFLSELKWDFKAVNRQTALDVSFLMESCKSRGGRPTGFIIDESSHLKKGRESVGIARQYTRVSGKADNCQVAVYGSHCNEENAALIDTALFLPEKWTEDQDGCDKAGITESERTFETKPPKALKMIQSNLNSGVKFD